MLRLIDLSRNLFAVEVVRETIKPTKIYEKNNLLLYINPKNDIDRSIINIFSGV